jgi:hypothetical protein
MIRKFLMLALVALAVGGSFGATAAQAAAAAAPVQNAGSNRVYHYRYRPANGTMWYYGTLTGNANQWSARLSQLQGQGYAVILISVS